MILIIATVFVILSMILIFKLAYLVGENKRLSISEATLKTKLEILEKGSLKEEMALTMKEFSVEIMDRVNHFSKDRSTEEAKRLSDIVTPIKESLSNLDRELKEMGKENSVNRVSLKECVTSVMESERELRRQTFTLIDSLKRPRSGGFWGEMQLRRVVEVSGMLEKCDFFEQPTQKGEDLSVRPDLLVKLPGNKHVIVDAKSPSESFLEAQGKESAVREKLLSKHTLLVREHIRALSKKSYWKYFKPSPEFVVLFLPSESFLATALERDPSLLEYATSHNVLISTPTTLIAILRSISHSWKEDKLSKSGDEIAKIGKKMHRELVKLNKLLLQLGKGLSMSVEGYHKITRSCDGKLLDTTKTLGELVGSCEIPKDFPEVSSVENS